MRRKGGEEKKTMVGLLVFYHFRDSFWPKKLFDAVVHLALTLSKTRLDIHNKQTK